MIYSELSFRIISDNIPWEDIENCYDELVTKSQGWFEFLCSSFNFKPYVIEISIDNVILGYFVGERIKKVVWIVSSPFEGFTTGYQGLSLKREISSDERLHIYSLLSKWLFKNKQCSFFQVADWLIEIDDVEKLSQFKYTPIVGYKLDLRKTEEELYSQLHYKSCKYSINKSIKDGVIIRKATDSAKFVESYYDQLLEVFSKQGLVPTYSKERVLNLINALDKYDNILCLEAVSKDGLIIATGIFPGSKNLAIYWGGASWRKYQKNCPNEPLIWEAIKYWHKRGTLCFEFGGGRSYKKKFGGTLFYKPRIEIAKYSHLLLFKHLAKKAYYILRKLHCLIAFHKSSQ